MKTKLDQKVMVKIAIIAAVVALIFGVFGFIPFLNIFTGIVALCASFLIVPVWAAYYAVRKHNVTKDMLADGLIVGGIAGLAAGVAYSIVSTIMTLIQTALGFGLSAVSNTIIDSADTGVDLAAAGAFTAVGGVIGACVLIVSMTVVAGIAGLIIAAVTENGGKK
ncbi:MAG: hypothetical protein ACE5DX_00985 [Candidatus Dojkabacteria bacterium]